VHIWALAGNVVTTKDITETCMLICRLADALEDNGGNEAAQDDYYDDAMDSQLLNSSRGKEVRPCSHTLPAAAFFCELLTLTLILKQTACFVHASDLICRGRPLIAACAGQL
jgi:hypothetical protein